MQRRSFAIWWRSIRLKKMGIKILDPRTSVGTGLDFNRTLRAFFGEEQRHFFRN